MTDYDAIKLFSDLDTDMEESQPAAEISKKSDEIFGPIGYGKKMERVMLNQQMQSNKANGNAGNLTEENIKNMEDNIRKRGRDAVEAAGMEDKEYMPLASKARRTYKKVKRGRGESRRGGMRTARKRTSTKKRKNTRRRRTRRQKK
jgi:hypothetical protein